MKTQQPSVILFDGVCVLCNRLVWMVIERDKAGKYCFASLQSAVAENLLAQHRIHTSTLDSLVLIESNTCYFKSTAALRIAKGLDGWWWRILAIALLIPTAMRDWIYDYVAHRRYRWFGKQVCVMPDENIRARFID